MRCNICNKPLTDAEVEYNTELDTWEPCGVCLEIIGEAFDDPLEEEEITRLIESEFPELFPLSFQEHKKAVTKNS